MLQAWTPQQELTATDGGASDNLGYSVAVSGETAVVGAIKYTGSTVGSAYVFVRSGGVWTEQQELTAPDETATIDSLLATAH